MDLVDRAKEMAGEVADAAGDLAGKARDVAEDAVGTITDRIDSMAHRGEEVAPDTAAITGTADRTPPAGA